MDLRRFAIVALVPAAIVAARFLVPWPHSGSWRLFFGITGFAATLLGCVLAVWFLHRLLQDVSHLRLVIVAILTAVVPLIAVFPSMGHWPLSNFQLVVAWSAITGAICGCSLYVAHRLHA